jgi:hypothetical protein
VWGVVGCPAIRRPRSRGLGWPPGHVLSKTISINSTMDFIDSMDFEGTYRPSPPHQSPSIHEIHVIHGPKKRAGGGATPSWGQRVEWMLCRGCWRTPGAWSVVAVLQPATVGRGEGEARWAMRPVRMGGCRGGRALKQPDYGIEHVGCGGGVWWGARRYAGRGAGGQNRRPATSSQKPFQSIQPWISSIAWILKEPTDHRRPTIPLSSMKSM